MRLVFPGMSFFYMSLRIVVAKKQTQGFRAIVHKFMGDIMTQWRHVQSVVGTKFNSVILPFLRLHNVQKQTSIIVRSNPTKKSCNSQPFATLLIFQYNLQQ